MKVFLLKDIQGVGFAGEIIRVKEGYAQNFLLPRKLAEAVTPGNEKHFASKIKTIENRKEAIATKTSMRAEQIKAMKFTIKRKMHNEKLYGTITPLDIVELLEGEGIKVAKNQIIFEKPIKTQGTFDVIVKLSNQLQPKLTLKVVPE